VANTTVELELVAVVSKAAKTVEDFVKTTQKSLSGISLNTTISAINDGFELVGKTAGRAFGVVADVISEAVDEAAAAEQAVTNLTNALRIQNDFSEEAIKDFNDFASSLQNVSIFSDEAALNSLALAKQFRATNSEAKRVVSVAADLAAITGTDLETATQKVAQTLNGFVDKSLAKAIPGLKSLSKEALISGAAIDVIKQRVDGSAEALSNTFNGAVAKTKNAFSDLLETVGSFVTENPIILEGIKQISKTFNDLNADLKNNGSSIKDLISGGFLLFIEAAPLVIEAAKNITRNLTALVFVGKGVGVVFGGIAAAVTTLFEGQKGAGQTILKAVQDDLDDLEVQFGTFLNKTDDGFDPVLKAATDLATKIRKINEETKKTAAIVKNGKSLSGPENRVVEKSIEDQKKAIEQAAKEPVKALIDFSATGKLDSNVGVAIGAGLVNNILKGAKGAQDLVASAIGGLADTILPGIGGVVSEIVGVLAQGPDKVKEFVKSFVDALPGVISAIVQSIPVLVEELSKAVPVIVQKLVDEIPTIVTALAKSMPTVAVALALQMPKVAIALITGIVQNIPEIVKGFAEEFLKIPQRFVEALLDAIPGVGGLFGGGGGSGGGIGSIPVIGDIIGGIGDVFGLAKGGRVPDSPRFKGDNFPARLDAGEQVLSNDLSSKLERFLGSPQNMTVNLVIGQQQFARAQFETNRRGFRTA